MGRRFCRGAAVHAPPLVGPAVVVGLVVGVGVSLHLVGGLVELLAAHETEVLVKERPVQPLGSIGT